MKYTLNGIIYRLIIDPILSRYYHSIIDELESTHNILDVACGTGSLSLAMSLVVEHVSGIDLSGQMIDIANNSAEKKNISNVRFAIRDASDLSSYSNNEFDVAVASMVIHQFDSDLAMKILVEMKRIALKVILMDYNYPIPVGIFRLVIFFIERIAGGDHYRNFKRFNTFGGLPYFIDESGLKVQSEKLRGKGAFRIVVCR